MTATAEGARASGEVTVTPPTRVVVLSAHEGPASWQAVLRSVQSTGAVAIHRDSGFTDHQYRNSKTPWQRVVLRFKEYIVYPLSVIVRSPLLSRRFDTVLVITSPFFLPAIVGFFVRGPRIVVLQNDIYPEALIVRKLISRGGLMDRVLSRVIAGVLKRASAVVYITEAHRDHVARLFGVSGVEVVIAVPSHMESGDVEHSLDHGPDIVTILYSGTLGTMHDTSTFLEYFARNPAPPGLKFIFRTSGAGKASFERAVQASLNKFREAGVIQLGDALPDAEWSATMLAAQVGLVFQDVGAGAVVFPSKVASILVAGQAVLAIAEESTSLGRLVIDSDCGWVVPPGDFARLNRAFSDAAVPAILETKRKNARQVGMQHFAVDVVANRWLHVLTGLERSAAAVGGVVDSPTYVFFAWDKSAASPRTVATEAESEVQFWTPSLTRVIPPGCPVWPFAAWWVCHVLHLFRSRDYCVVLHHDNGVLTHRSCVFPKFYRFPFMQAGDLQVGDVWTAPESRGQGLAQTALARIIERFSGRRIWYICDESNVGSVKVAQRVGMRMQGFGERTTRAGLRLLGQFQISRAFTKEVPGRT